jgi:hypothetical protein
LGDPFGSLGCLRGYVDNYGTLDGSDYHTGATIGAIMRFCNASELSTAGAIESVKNALQSAVGSSRFRIRMQFSETMTDSDGVYVLRDRRCGVDRRKARATLEDLLILFSQAPSGDPGKEK